MKNILVILMTLSLGQYDAIAQLINQNPSNSEVCSGELASFFAGVSSEVDSMQWEHAVQSNGPWMKPVAGVVGVNTDTLIVTQTNSYNGHFFRLVAWDLDAPEQDTSESASLLVNPLPTPELVSTPPDFAFCEGNTLVLKTITSYVNYTWMPGNLTTDSIIITNPGTYSVTVTDVNSCSNSTSQSVIRYPRPNFQIIPSTPKYCPGDTIEIMTSDAFNKYQWNTDDTTRAIHVFTSGNYRVTVTDDNNCTNSNIVSVSPYMVVAPNIIPNPKEFCEGSSLTIYPDEEYSKYKWSTGIGDTLRQLIVSTPGQYSLTVTDQNGCSSTSFTQVTSNPIPESKFRVSDSSAPLGTVFRFTDESIPAVDIVQWKWNFGPSATIQEITYDQPGNFTNIEYFNPGIKTTCLETTNKHMCKDTSCSDLIVTSPQGLSIIPFPNIDGEIYCIGVPIDITISAINPNPLNDSLIQNINWSFDPTVLAVDTSFLPEGNNTLLSERARITFIKDGGSTITASARTFKKIDPSITNEGSIEMTAFGDLTPSIVTSDIPDFLCGGDTVTVAVEITPIDDGTLKYSINGVQFPLLNIVQGQTEIEFIGQTNQSSINFEILEIILSSGCKSENVFQKLIPIRTLPDISIVSVTGRHLICEGELDTLIASGATTYTWLLDNQFIGTGANLPIGPGIIGEYDYAVRGTLNGCSTTSPYRVTVAPPPTPMIVGENTACKGQVLEYKSTDSDPAHSWTVTGGEILGSNDTAFVTIKWASTGILKLLQQVGECKDSTTSNVTLSSQESPPYNELVYLPGGGILLYSNPQQLSGLCYQWRKDMQALPGEIYQGYVIGKNVPAAELDRYSLDVWYCSGDVACGQRIAYRSQDITPEDSHPQGFSAVPNPNHGEFQITYKGLSPGIYKQQIIAISGDIIHIQDFEIIQPNGNAPIHLADVSPGIYIVRWMQPLTGAVHQTRISIIP